MSLTFTRTSPIFTLPSLEHAAFYQPRNVGINSVIDLHFAHPDSRYFAVYPIGRDQVADYARRKGQSVAETERWLAPYLGYDPAR